MQTDKAAPFIQIPYYLYFPKSSCLNTDLLLKTLRARVIVPDEEYREYFAMHELRQFKKGEHIFRQGDIPRYSIFILKGCMRNYYIGLEGIERITYFSEEGYWAGDLECMRKQEPTVQNLQVLENTHVLTVSRENWEIAYHKFSWLSAIHAIGQQRRAAKLTEHIGKLLTDTPEVNYQRLLKERPALILRVPQHYIASYLGITPETLSRIRKKMSL